MVCIVALALLDSQTYLVQKDKCLDRRYQKVIVWKNQTRGSALYRVATGDNKMHSCFSCPSWMYWTDWEEDKIDDSVGRIEKAWMDGFNRQIFVTSKMLWPNGLTLDFRTNTLYWCDAYYDHIEKVFLNGTHRKVKDKCCCF